MATYSEPAGRPASAQDATRDGQKRQSEPPPEPPIKQHNPGDQGINPGQKGPAQPAGHDDSAKDSGT